MPDTFTAASPDLRVRSLFDAPDAIVPSRAGLLVSASGVIGGGPAHVAATDPSVARGAIGAEEARALAQLLRRAREERVPVVLLLDSSGARVDQGLAALGAFRQLYREALLAALDGLPMLALLGRACFGGASMIACVCEQRVYLPTTRLATSGPAVIEAAQGKSVLDAGDQQAVFALMGAPARVALHPEDWIREDSLLAARSAALQWLQAGGHGRRDFGAERVRLLARLPAPGMPARPGKSVDTERLSALLPKGYLASVCGHLLRAVPARGRGKALFIGALGGDPIDARDCLQLAEWLLAIPHEWPESPVVLILDARAHAATVEDERVMLSDYLVHLSTAIGLVARAGSRIVLWIPGAASGASYVAFAAGADRVSALPAARLAVLPPGAVREIIGEAAAGGTGASPREWIESGVADALLDARLERYAEDNLP
jgi:carboxyltransferase family protein/malonate decarboxylase gamma subunit MdcE